MTRADKLMALAGKMGWTDIQLNFDSPTGYIGKNSGVASHFHSIRYQGYDDNNIIRSDSGAIVPDYTADLNALREVKGKMTDKQWSQYPIWLAKVIAGTQNKPRASGTRIHVPQHVLLYANAQQEAETLLRIFKLWKDN